MKITTRLLVLSIIFLTTTIAQLGDGSKADWDGPYVIYKGNEIIAKSIYVEDGIAKPKVEKINIEENKTPELNVHFGAGPDSLFKVVLKEKIEIAEFIIPEPSKILYMSDIEGNFNNFRDMLVNNGVIDKDFNWTYGTGHLAIVGDMFDRGLTVLPGLWLLYSLENKAAEAGGQVHLVLGNHDLMNMTNDLRYVADKFFKNAGLMREKYSELFNENTELGRWLRSKNLVQKIGKSLIVHGGVSNEVANLGFSIQQINEIAHPNYSVGYRKIKYGNNELLKALMGSSVCPFWYRGYFKDDTEASVDSVLTAFNAEQVIVGHSVVDNVDKMFDGKVIAVDVHHASDNTQGLLIENGNHFRVYKDGKREEL